MAVRPAHDPAAAAREGASEGVRAHDRPRARVLPAALDARTARIEIADPLDTLEKPCYDLKGLTRNYDFLTTVSRYVQRARLGQLRERPRGRERPVRAELHLCRRADELRPGDLLPLHGPHPRPAARPAATFMPKPFSHLTGSGCHFHMSLWDGDEPVPGRDRPARPRPVRARLPLHRRAEAAREGVHRDHRPDRQLVQAAEVGGRRSGATWSPVYVTLRLQQPHADAAHPRAGSDRGPHDRRLVQPVPGGGRRARGRARRHREQARPGRAEHREHVRRRRRGARKTRDRGAAREPARRDTGARARRSSCARRSAAAATRTTSTTSSASSETSGAATTSR